jgi:hypothetical protein
VVMCNDLTDASHLRSDRRHAERHRLHVCNSEGLNTARKHERICSAQATNDLVLGDRSGKLDRFFDSKLLS